MRSVVTTLLSSAFISRIVSCQSTVGYTDFVRRWHTRDVHSDVAFVQARTYDARRRLQASDYRRVYACQWATNVRKTIANNCARSNKLNKATIADCRLSSSSERARPSTERSILTSLFAARLPPFAWERSLSVIHLSYLLQCTFTRRQAGHATSAPPIVQSALLYAELAYESWRLWQIGGTSHVRRTRHIRQNVMYSSDVSGSCVVWRRLDLLTIFATISL